MKGWDAFLDILDRVAAGGGVFMLPGEYADLCRTGTLPLEPRALVPDPALECAARAALNKWDGPLTKEDLSGVKTLEWSLREPRIRSLAGAGRSSGTCAKPTCAATPSPTPNR